MSLEWILLGLRLLATLILYAFLAAAFYLIWRQLRQTETQHVAGPPAMDQLRVIGTPAGQSLVVGQTLPLPPAMVLGCAPDNTVVINPVDPLAGQAHLRREEGGWWLESLGQPERVKLNNNVLAGGQTLAHGDVISLDDTQFRFEMARP